MVEPIQCDSDEELSKILHQLLVVDGHKEVEVVHPIDGVQVVTKETFEAMIENIIKARNMSPADRLLATKRIKRKMEIRFRTAMITAEIRTVDIEDDKNFGRDIDGKEMDINGMTFVKADDYFKGIQVSQKELGCFMDESMARPPIRILEK